MIRKVDMYQCVCDRCGKSHVDDFNGLLLGVMKTMQQKQPMKVIGPTLKGKIIVQIAMIMMKNQKNIHQRIENESNIHQTAVGEPYRSRYQRHREPDMEMPSEVYRAKGTDVLLL